MFLVLKELKRAAGCNVAMKVEANLPFHSMGVVLKFSKCFMLANTYFWYSSVTSYGVYACRYP